jgi:hypothetical protein
VLLYEEVNVNGVEQPALAGASPHPGAPQCYHVGPPSLSGVMSVTGRDVTSVHHTRLEYNYENIDDH